MRPMSKASRLALLLIWVLLTAASATYIPWNVQGPVSSASSQKSNNAQLGLGSVQRRRHKPIFRNDAVGPRRLILIFKKTNKFKRGVSEAIFGFIYLICSSRPTTYVSISWLDACQVMHVVRVAAGTGTISISSRRVQCTGTRAQVALWRCRPITCVAHADTQTFGKLYIEETAGHQSRLDSCPVDFNIYLYNDGRWINSCQGILHTMGALGSQRHSER